MELRRVSSRAVIVLLLSSDEPAFCLPRAPSVPGGTVDRAAGATRSPVRGSVVRLCVRWFVVIMIANDVVD